MEPTLVMSVRLLRLGVHDLVHERFGHDADELLDVDHPILNLGVS